MATIEILNNISQQINIYLGIPMFIMGIIGSLWNILIFRHYSLRLSSCCIYMLTVSLASLIQIIFGLLTRILAEGFQIDWSITNIAWCKIRSYVTFCASLTSLSCLVWSAIDRFFSTCRQIKWRRLNSIYIAKQICLLTIIFWMIITLPTLVYHQPIQTKIRVCGSTSLLWTRFLVYFFNLFCYGIFPSVFLSIFGILTLKNLRQIHHRRINPLPTTVVTRMTYINNQLISMLFLQIIISIISTVPYGVQTIYNNLTQSMIKDEYRLSQENLFLQIVRLAFYFNYISMFYVNYISSLIFRRLSKKVLENLFKKKTDISRDITIINHQINEKKLIRKKLNISTIQTPYKTTHF